MFFESWSSLGRTALSGVIAYAALIVFLRISGKRTLAKLNAFDLVVTVAIGSTFSAVLTSPDLPLADGLLALALLIGLQYLVAWLTIHSGWFERLVKSRPAAVFLDGEFQKDAMRRERVARDEVLMAARSAGIRDLDRVALVILESDGSLNAMEEVESPPARPVTVGVAGVAEQESHAGREREG